jgi:hypothetical protein
MPGSLVADRDAQEEFAASKAPFCDEFVTCFGLGPGIGFEKAFVAPLSAAFICLEEGTELDSEDGVVTL